MYHTPKVTAMDNAVKELGVDVEHAFITSDIGSIKTMIEVAKSTATLTVIYDSVCVCVFAKNFIEHTEVLIKAFEKAGYNCTSLRALRVSITELVQKHQSVGATLSAEEERNLKEAISITGLAGRDMWVLTTEWITMKDLLKTRGVGKCIEVLKPIVCEKEPSLRKLRALMYYTPLLNAWNLS